MDMLNVNWIKCCMTLETGGITGDASGVPKAGGRGGRCPLVASQKMNTEFVGRKWQAYQLNCC